MDRTDTIFAPATGSETAAIAVIRLSGPAAHTVIATITGQPCPPARQLTLCHLSDGDGVPVDQAMVVIFPEGASYTGEAMAEIQCHGGRGVVDAILTELARQNGCRLAEPGEFTRRAILNGRMDLADAEALGDLIAAETREQHRQAMATMAGAVGRRAEAWRADLIRARALLEVTIDWADEEVPEDVGPEVRALLDGVMAGFDLELGRAAQAERMRTGFEVAIIGPPNAGKSSLLNAIAGRDAAITSERAGTTRDVLEIRYDLNGLPVMFLDTAGLRATDDPIESIGVGRAMGRARAAALRLHLAAPDAGQDPVFEDLWTDGDLRVATKSDLGAVPGEIAVSVRDDRGIDALLRLVETRLRALGPAGGLLGHRRRQMAVADARDHLARASADLDAGDVEVVAEHLRSATSALDRLTGRLDMDDVLDAVFSSFCLGK